MTADLAAEVARVLAAHIYMRPGGSAPLCDCGAQYPHGPGDLPTPVKWHRAHVAAEVTNALTTTLDGHRIVWASNGVVGCDCSPDTARGGNAYRDHLFAAIPEALGAGEDITARQVSALERGMPHGLVAQIGKRATEGRA